MKFIMCFILFSTIVISWFIGCGSDTKLEESGNKIAVKTAKVVQEEISMPIHASGILSAAKEMRLSFKIGGIVDKIFVDEGESVKKGQLLAQLDLREIQAQVNQACSAFEKAERDHQRVKNLYAESVVTLEQVQNAETGLEVAKSNLEIVQFNLKHSKIVAPFDGKILKRFVEVSELIGPGNPVYYFGVTGDEWRVRMGVSETDIVDFQLGDSAIVIFDAYPDEYFPASVTEIAESADPISGTFEIEVQLNSKARKLVSGFVAKVDLFPSKKKKYYLIPIEALVEADGETAYVFSPLDGKVKEIQIKVGSIYNQSVAVLSGLENIAEVVTDGAPYLTDGSEIEIVK